MNCLSHTYRQNTSYTQHCGVDTGYTSSDEQVQWTCGPKPSKFPTLMTKLHYPSSGKEKDSETGLSYFGARYYEPEMLNIWLSVDPMADKYPNMSPYNYCAWNPIKLVDLDGSEIGDYYTPIGKYLGSDGEIYVVPFRKDQREVKNGNFDIEKYELPSLEARKLMCDYLESSNQNDNLREYGGSVWKEEISGNQEIRCAIPGNKWDGKSQSASVVVTEYGYDGFNATGKRLLTYFHSHFSGTINGNGLRQYPSGIGDGLEYGDIQNVMSSGVRFGNARLPYNIMIAMKTKSVFLYTTAGVKCKKSMDVFRTMGESK